MIVIKETVLSFIKRLNEKHRQCVITTVAITTAVVILICLLFSGTTISYNVIYDGKVVAQITDTSVYDSAFENASQIVGSSDVAELLSKAEIKPVLSAANVSNSSDELTNIIIDNSKKVSRGYVLNVDGQPCLYLSSEEELNAALNERLNMYNSLGSSCESKFESDISVTSGYFKEADLNTKDEMSAYINTLNVITVATDTVSQKIPFDTVVKKSASKNAGYSVVTTKGVNGVKELSKKITYLNGEVTEELLLSEETISKPVNEVVVVGTASASKGSSNKYATSGEFTYPIDKSVYSRVTSYWGDGRNHKAVDIAAAKGTKIFASLSGTVTYSGYRSDYGYNIIVDHGNGIQTRYAHCSKLYVKAGEKVTAGQTIALMGSTGQSTGPHLHFEVIINGTRVDPAPYIGLY